MKAMFSIKPRYVEQILLGNKTYEFRRRIFKRTDVDTLVIYSTLPQGAVVAEAHIDGILKSSPNKIWRQTHKYGGMSKSEFMKYFEGSSLAFAIRLGNVRRFKTPLPLKDYSEKIACPPQFFTYID